jgi:hypothetical protein
MAICVVTEDPKMVKSLCAPPIGESLAGQKFEVHAQGGFGSAALLGGNTPPAGEGTLPN